MKVVDSFTNPWDAYVVRGLLESEGIEAYVFYEHHVWVNWPISNAVGGVVLVVTDEDQQLAKEVLLSLQKGHYERALMEECELKEFQCNLCGSRNTRYVRSLFSTLLAFALLVTIAAPFSPKISSSVCVACNNRDNTF